MKITALEMNRISVPFAEPYHLSKVYGTIHDAQAVILRIHTDEGLIGLGEADPLLPFSDETPAGVMAAIRDYLAPRLLGADPRRIGGLTALMDQVMYGNNMARGAVDMALHDLKAKSLEIPVHDLLGGAVRQRLEIMWGMGSASPEEDIARVEAKMAEGFTTFMAKMGSLPIHREVERIKTLRQYFGRDIKLVADANQGWRVDQAVRFVEGLRGVELQMLEQPVARLNHHGLRRIHAICPWPLSADESVYHINDALELIKTDTVDVLSIKISKNGGLAPARRIAELAAAGGLRILMNSMLEFGVTQAASLHLGATLTNLMDLGHAYGSPLRLSDDITDYSRLVEGSTVRVPAGPGLGINIDEAKLAKYTNDHLKMEL